MVQALQTNRLLLRAMTPDDADDIARMQMDPVVMAFYGDGRPLDENTARETVTRYHVACREHGYWAWAATLLATHEVLGQVTAGYSDIAGPRSIELGFIFKAAAWGKGYGPEAVQAVIAHGRDTLGWHAIAAGVSDRNTRSIRLCKRIGMTHVQTVEGRRGDMKRIFVVPI